jgi:hypothetical protein
MTVGLGQFEARFSITITSNESVRVTDEMRDRVRKTLQEALNDSKVKRKLERNFDLHQDDVRCEVGEVIVEPKK